MAASVIAGIGGARGDTVLKDAMKEAAPALLAGRTQARLIAQARGGLCRIIVGLGHANQRGLIDVLELIDVFVHLRGAAIDRRPFIITGTGLFVADTFAEIGAFAATAVVTAGLVGAVGFTLSLGAARAGFWITDTIANVRACAATPIGTTKLALANGYAGPVGRRRVIGSSRGGRGLITHAIDA